MPPQEMIAPPELTPVQKLKYDRAVEKMQANADSRMVMADFFRIKQEVGDARNFTIEAVEQSRYFAVHHGARSYFQQYRRECLEALCDIFPHNDLLGSTGAK